MAKLNLLLFHPTKFFESIKNEKDEWISIKWAFGSFIIFGFISVVIFLILHNLFADFLISLGSFSRFIDPQGDVSSLWLFALLVVAQMVLLPVFHWLIVKLGGKSHRYQTTKSIMYALVPFFMIAWLPIVGFISMFWSIYVEYIGLKVLHKFDLKQFILYVIGSLLIWILALGVLIILLIILVAVAVLLFSAVTNTPIGN